MGMLMRKFLGVFIYLFWLPIFTTYLILSNLLPMLQEMGHLKKIFMKRKIYVEIVYIAY